MVNKWNYLGEYLVCWIPGHQPVHWTCWYTMTLDQSKKAREDLCDVMQFQVKKKKHIPIHTL